MKNKEMIELPTKELVARLKEERTRLAKMKFNHTVAPIENPSQIKDSKVTVAQILTELRKRQLEGINK